MRIVKPLDSNLQLNPPEGDTNNVQVLHCFTCRPNNGVRQTYSLWEPNEEERLGLMMGLPIMIGILGEHFPPIVVGVAKEQDIVSEGFL